MPRSKTTHLVILSTTVPYNLKKLLIEIATQNGVSVSSLLTRILTDNLKDYKDEWNS